MKIKAGKLSPLIIFEHLYNGYGSFLLESPPTHPGCRHSFIGCDPITTIYDFTTLQKYSLGNGAFGFFAYDFAWQIEKLPHHAKNDLSILPLQFVLPATLIIYDHKLHEIEILSPNASKLIEQLVILEQSLIHHKTSPHNTQQFAQRYHTTPPSNFTKVDFEETVQQAKNYIYAGDIYQVNLSQRFAVPIQTSAWETYKKLRQINPSPFASFFDFGNMQIVSCSPERLVKLENGLVQTRPIAGTRPISAAEKELLLDPKEQAEHLMLVDLERNDLGRVCEYASVMVDELMVIENYSHVRHIVSNVSGRLRQDKNQFDLIKAVFPGGTITGCPKIRSMEIIEELEPVKRGLYTGSIGYIMGDKMDFNIAIRTMLIKDGMAYIQTGAGIVADSVPENEYYETLHKAEAMFECLW